MKEWQYYNAKIVFNCWKSMEQLYYIVYQYPQNVSILNTQHERCCCFRCSLTLIASLTNHHESYIKLTRVLSYALYVLTAINENDNDNKRSFVLYMVLNVELTTAKDSSQLNRQNERSVSNRNQIRTITIILVSNAID